MRALRKLHWGLKLGLLVVEVELAGLLIGWGRMMGLIQESQFNLASFGALVFFVLWAALLFLE